MLRYGNTATCTMYNVSVTSWWRLKCPLEEFKKQVYSLFLLICQHFLCLRSKTIHVVTDTLSYLYIVNNVISIPPASRAVHCQKSEKKNSVCTDRQSHINLLKEESTLFIQV